MLRHLLVTAGLALAAQAAHAADAGKIIFVAGNAQVVDRPASEGARVQEGELLTTGADGFIYVKTIDNGLFILRPNTTARIATYHVDARNPANTRIKLELLSGVARSRSGEAVKLARQNFRFNTPVAAIGVRGTDFTVFTDDNTSRVAVISGGIVVSGFADACRPEGAGPCDGTASRELSAAQRGQLLQVRRGQATPQLMQGGTLGPDEIAPPRGDEPIGKNAGASVELNLDAKKSERVSAAVGQVPLTSPPPPVVDVPQAPERQVLWGRWQPVLGNAPTIGLAGPEGSERIVAGNFAIFRTTGRDYVAPEQGSIGFAMKGGEAYVFNDDPTKSPVAATMNNGKLNVDFGSKSFATSFDLAAGGDVYKMRADGALRSDGRLFGNSAFIHPTNMNVDGVLSNENGGSAAYLFQGRLDDQRTANGVTFWGK
ncbi:FecR family protein [Massilia cavernae]|uniref:FecR protein domain-containing protein n=1 Tax=Massilia cavernae TaxID=2320864 RepID=A0A418XGY5_9BURK|nr:FecR family protein [Massilia cavernae]RJG11729.1 hypothetical protein D3872_18190 [Massilia cavernae]